MQVERIDLSVSGERLSKAQVTCPLVGDNPEKSGLIPHKFHVRDYMEESLWALKEGLVSYQVVGKVTAYQARDG